MLRIVIPMVLAAGVSATGSAQVRDVQIDFDGWPDDPCVDPGQPICEGAWVDRPDDAVTEMRVNSCGLGRCMRVRWDEDQAVRRIETPWAPPAGTRTAYVEIRIQLQDDYFGPTPSGFAGPLYQPLARLHGADRDTFGIDLAMIHRGDGEPVIALVSAPDTAASGVGFFVDLDTTCALTGRLESRFITIRAEVTLDETAESLDTCRLEIDGLATRSSERMGLDFRGDVSATDADFRSATFLGRVSNESDEAACNLPGWPPCGVNGANRTVVVDDLCVSDRLEAATDGTCEPGVVDVPDTGVPPVPTPTPTDGYGFRGVGGCDCHAASNGGTPDFAWLILGMSMMVLGWRHRRRLR